MSTIFTQVGGQIKSIKMEFRDRNVPVVIVHEDSHAEPWIEISDQFHVLVMEKGHKDLSLSRDTQIYCKSVPESMTIEFDTQPNQLYFDFDIRDFKYSVGDNRCLCSHL